MCPWNIYFQLEAIKYPFVLLCYTTNTTWSFIADKDRTLKLQAHYESYVDRLIHNIIYCGWQMGPVTAFFMEQAMSSTHFPNVIVKGHTQSS